MGHRSPRRHRLGNGHHGGWKPDKPKSGKDWHLKKVLGEPKRALPDMPSCDPAFFPLLKNQKNLGSCTGESVAYAVEYCVISMLAAKGQDVTSSWWKKWGLSGLAGYYWAREIEKAINEDTGAEIRDAIDGARRNGLPTEESWPYIITRFTQRPDAAAMKTAPWHKPGQLKTYRCDGAGGSREDTLTNMLRALELKMPVNFGFGCPADWKDYDATGRIPMPNGQYDGGHAITSLKADTASKDLIGPNTWGDRIGAPQPPGSRIITRGGKGWFILPFQYVLNGDADDAWAVAI
jgi:hypothetical protein